MKILRTLLDVLSIVLAIIIIIGIFCGEDTTRLVLDMVWIKLLSVELHLIEMKEK